MLKKVFILITLAIITLTCFNLVGCKSIERFIQENKQFVFTLNDDGESYWVRSGKKYKYENTDGKRLEIPSEYKDLPVTKIGWNAFDSLGYSSVVIPETVTAIMPSAFYECKQLKSVEWHNNITEIGAGAFGNCENLKEIQIPDKVENIQVGTFNGCKTLDSVILPNGLKKIETHAFWYCESLERIELPNTVEKIDFGAFANSKITYVNQPDNLTSVGYKIFAETPYADKNSGNVVENRLIFGDFLVEDYNTDKNLIIPNGVKGLADMLYQNNPFESITISESLQYLGSSTFRYANNPKQFIVDENNAYYATVDGVLYDKDLTTLIQYPIAKEDESFTILQSVDSVGACAFENAENLKQINFHDGVKEIGYYAITGLTGLTSLEIPNTVEKFESNYFMGCENLVSVTLPDCITDIESRMFMGCTSLKSIVIPDGVQHINYEAFYGCTSLKSVDFGSELMHIESGAFTGCESLEEIVLPEKVVEFYASAFIGCKNLKTITFTGDGVRMFLGFNGCDSLEKIILPTYDGWVYRKNPKAEDNIITDEFSSPEKVAEFFKNNGGWLYHE